MKLADLGEFGLIDRIASRVGRHGSILLGIGDDAAGILPTPGTATLLTSDMLVEAIHFDPAFTSPRLLGRKTLAVNLSDIAAMGGTPRCALLSMAIPAATSLEFVEEMIAGFLERADEHGVTLIGGDTCASSGGLVLSVTLLGEQAPHRILKRSGAAAGDLICVTGTIGDSSLGLDLLRQGERSGEPVLRHLDPTPRVREGIALAEAGIPSAMIDISDGLLADLGHILKQSSVGARLLLSRLPLSPSFRTATAGNSDPYRYPLSGGEDYELLFTLPPEREEMLRSLFPAATSAPFTVIGEITEEMSLIVIGESGSPHSYAATGYNHFSPTGPR